jgi:histone deacetylase 11
MEEEDFLVAEPVSEALLARVHDADYLAGLHDPRLLSRALEVEVPGVLRRAIPRRVLEPFRTATGGTVAAARAALEHGVGINLGGGYHHARPALGHGFCIYNDVAVALHVLRAEGFAGRVLIVDTDAHQGDGNHAFFASDPSVYSFSMHQGDLFPEPKLAGDEDVELPGGMGDAEIVSRLEERLPELLDEIQPALVVHVAGADVLDDDPLTGLAMTADGLVLRDRLVLREARRHGVPLLHLLAGGYGPSAAGAQLRSVAGMLADLSPSVGR